MPSLPGRAGDHGLTWRAYTGTNIVRSADIIKGAAAGKLPALSMVWYDSPLDEHPVADVSKGMDATWQIVDAVVKAGLRATTASCSPGTTGGGYDDHVPTRTSNSP
jgi:phospholipase C